jgi:hypothetical protein
MMTTTLTLTLSCCALLGSASTYLPPYERSAVPRFPLEGGGSAIVCDSSLQGGTALRARIQSVGCFLQQAETTGMRPGNCLTGTVGHSTDADMIELATPLRHNASCLQVDTGTVTHEGSGSLSVSVNGGANWTGGGLRTPPDWWWMWSPQHAYGGEIMFFERVAVAFSRRPYIHEPLGELLLRTDPALAASLAASKAPVQLSIALPFAATVEQQTQTFTSATNPSLLRVVEMRLLFSFAGLPATINQDVFISITADGRTYTKVKRMQRYPPPANSSTALVVQVDHSTRSLLVDGRVFAGNGYYVNFIGQGETGGYHNDGLSYNGAAASLLRDAQRGVNQGMIYELGTFTAEQQLAILDELHSGGYKVLYDLMSPLCALRPEDTACMHSVRLNGCLNGTGPDCISNNADLRSVIDRTVGLVKDHPAVLAYYICDDCCYSDNGTSFQSQAYNYIKELDPYHAVVGAVQCAPSWSFLDSPSQITPTSNLSQAVIGLGEQPATQISLDYIMQENYGRRFVDSSCNGSWAQCIGGDGILRNGIRFEPLVNCLGVGAFGSEQADGPSEEKFASLAYLGLIEAGMMDHLTFVIDSGHPSDGYQVDAQTRVAEQFRELRPSLQGTFGANFELTAAIEAVGDDAPGCDRSYLGSCLRAKVFEEETKAGGGGVCAHLIVVNVNATFAAQFRVTLGSGGKLAPTGPAVRLFGMGKNLSISAEGALDTDWIAPGGHNVYRIGCAASKPVHGNVIKSVKVGIDKIDTQGPQRGMYFSKAIFAGDMLWGTSEYHDSSVDRALSYGQRLRQPLPEALMQSDTAVSRTGRHSVKVTLPSADPLVFPLPGPSLASHNYNCTNTPPAASKASWAKTGSAPCPGDLVTGSSISLPRTETWLVTLYFQASPVGTRVDIMEGGWNFTSAVQRNWQTDQTVSGYIGQPIASATSSAELGSDGHRVWQKLTTRVEKATAPAVVALQVRVAPPVSERGFGASVWLADVSVTKATANE